jgi:hypothetical protein
MRAKILKLFFFSLFLGLVLGVTTDGSDRFCHLTPTGAKYNETIGGRLLELLLKSGLPPRLGESRLVHSVDPNFPAVAASGLGDKCSGFNKRESLDEGAERIRVAAAIGCQQLQKLYIDHIYVPH